ncbi:DedA family protein [Pseudoroseicyclus tamaricis]|uniref:VTT domain-containing protein n=1 Tax=Pseudoroseicyclus tamaricis TaxID=2705421 RepID=A0A6B2JTC4_9RHOB|nr:VTT domain-containing protein [Pseudoroseicyclus tamaricis]NDV01807.1 hypothetical protein [Pseudoroseicyclus tamaricis]
MTDWLLPLVPTYGALLLGVAIFLSCFAVPIPASIMLLAAGGFVAVGDLGLVPVAGAAALGLVAGNEAVYWLGRGGGGRLAGYFSRRSRHVARASALLARRGGPFLFLSRWLFSPLGPYVTFAAGAARQPWAVWCAWGRAGELIWLALYLGLGYVFADSLEQASDMAFNVLLLLGSLAVTLFLGIRLFGARQRRRRRRLPDARETAPEGPDA